MQRWSGVQTSNRLSRSIYGARHVSFFDWSFSRIETSLRLSCTFPIKTNLLLSFLQFPTETYCQGTTVIVVRATRQHCLTDSRHTCPVRLLCPSLTKKNLVSVLPQGVLQIHFLSQFFRLYTSAIIVRSVCVV